MATPDKKASAAQCVLDEAMVGLLEGPGGDKGDKRLDQRREGGPEGSLEVATTINMELTTRNLQLVDALPVAGKDGGVIHAHRCPHKARETRGFTHKHACAQNHTHIQKHVHIHT